MNMRAAVAFEAKERPKLVELDLNRRKSGELLTNAISHNCLECSVIQIQTATGANYRLRHVDPQLVEKMSKCVNSLKPDHIMNELGISLNTWKKLLDGEPIRASVAQRVITRFGRTEDFAFSKR